jgi:hypothetical protein
MLWAAGITNSNFIEKQSSITQTSKFYVLEIFLTACTWGFSKKRVLFSKIKMAKSKDFFTP